MATASASESAFRYEAVARDGRRVRDMVMATDEAAAVRRLTADGLTVTHLAPAATGVKSGSDRKLKSSERVLVIRQLALMLRAGVPLLEALETVTSGIDAARGRREFETMANALRGGESFADALAAYVSDLPFYVYALARVGEASGRLAEVLQGAAEQMAYEDRLRKEFLNALTYPAFLACAGLAAILFIFVEVVPRFSAMIGAGGGRLPPVSRAVLQAGAFVSENLLAVAATLGLIGAGAAATLASPAGRARLYALGRETPVLGRLFRTREILVWARLTGFALSNGVEILSAAALGRQALPDGPFARGLLAFEADLKAGLAVDAALARHTRLPRMDLSLLRTGQRTGALGAMFEVVASRYDDEMRDAMKRFTALLEPLAIGAIAGVVGVIALSLVMALTSVYDAVG